jgi:hypothetical protein
VGFEAIQHLGLGVKAAFAVSFDPRLVSRLEIAAAAAVVVAAVYPEKLANVGAVGEKELRWVAVRCSSRACPIARPVLRHRAGLG